MKDHEIREIVNQARDIAEKYGQTQQLRAHLAELLVPLLRTATAAKSPETEPIYQMRDSAGFWRDVAREQWEQRSENWRRIVYPEPKGKT